MSSRIQIEDFLSNFKLKLKIYGVVFLQRDKNLDTLIKLELTTVNRTSILQALTYQDYYKGPTPDYDKGAELWEFGVEVKHRDVYIKITMGHTDRPVICISFHIAERRIKYPFK